MGRLPLPTLVLVTHIEKVNTQFCSTLIQQSLFIIKIFHRKRDTFDVLDILAAVINESGEKMCTGFERTEYNVPFR